MRTSQIPLWLALAMLSATVASGERSLTVEPQQPTADDVLTVSLHDDVGISHCIPQLSDVTVQDGEIHLEVIPPSGCILIIVPTPYTLTATVGPLPAGTYDIVAELEDFGDEDFSVSMEVTVGAAAGESSPPGLGCVPAHRPGATLLVPYFEVDLENPGGRNSLFSVHNAAASPRLAHVVVWTNWGVPVLSFDLALPADGAQPINLRSVLVSGTIAETSLPPEAAPDFPGCATPIETPVLDETALAELRDRLSGQMGEDGFCAAASVEDGQVITGFVTVDAVSDCSGAALRYPGADADPTYFVDGGTGLATNDNVLWGDYFLIDAEGNSAQGMGLVSVIADAERFGIETASFYQVGIDNRAPLGVTYRTRFLRGGGFDGETDLLVWIKGGPGSVRSCLSQFHDVGLSAIFRDESGAFDSQFETFGAQRVLRLRVGDEPWPVAGNFGTVDLSFESFLGGTTEPFPDADQGLVVPVLRAEGRFSVAYDAVQIDGFCP